jgi:hypothetical protein
MRKSLLVLTASVCLGLAGCAVPTAPIVKKNEWVAITDADRFADSPVRMVTIGEPTYSESLFMTKFKHYYPFVQLKDGELIVGIRSGGQYKIPAGAVQMRIDGNMTWDISPEETPVYLIPDQATLTVSIPKTTPVDTNTPHGKAMADSMAASKAMTEEMRENTPKYLARTLSPFTAATGDKAKAIIKEMFSGRRIIYRSIGYNQADSTEGEVLIDESFNKAMSEIGVNRGMLD